MTVRTFFSILALTGLLFVSGGSAAAVSEDDRGAALRKHRSELSPTAAPSVASTSGECWSWPQNTTVNMFTLTPEPFPRADIVEFCAEYRDDVLTVRTRVAQPTDPVADSNWLGLTGALWGLDNSGDGEDDYTIGYVRAGSQIAVVVSDAQDQTTCERVGEFTGSFYVAAVPAGCFGAPSQTRVDAFMLYDSNPTDPDAPIYADLTDRRTVQQGQADPIVDPGSRDTGRLAGATRVETAVEISKHAFPNGAAEVYLARQDDYPDALAGGALTNGPVLLVPRCGSLPSAVHAEIQRLDPDRVLALGGSAAICDDILRAAAR